jgi:hypothetical protein
MTNHHSPSSSKLTTSVVEQINTQILLPIGVLEADLKPLPKTVALFLWHQSGCFHRPFHCHPGEILSWFAIGSNRASANVFGMLEEKGLIEVYEKRPGGRMLIELTENIWRFKTRSSQPSLDLFQPSNEFGGNPLLPRLLVPEAFLGSKETSATQKLVGWCALWRGDVRSKIIRIVHSEFARELGMDRSNLRKASLELIKTEFFESLETSESLLLRWSDQVFSEQQRNDLLWLSSSNVLAAKHLLDLLYPGCEVDCAPVSPRLPASLHASPRGEVVGASVLSRGAVVCASVSPRNSDSLHASPRSEVVCAIDASPREPDSLHVSPRPVPHNHNHDIDNMLCGHGDDGDELRRRVLQRERLILSYASQIDLTETRFYMVRVWALMVETEIVKDQADRVMTVSAEDCERFLETAAKLNKNGGYLMQAFRDCVRATNIEAGFWRKQAEQVSREIGLTYGRDMRNDVGGPTPATPIARTPSTTPRGGDQLDDSEKKRGEAYKFFRKIEKLSHPDAMNKIEELTRQGVLPS